MQSATGRHTGHRELHPSTEALRTGREYSLEATHLRGGIELRVVARKGGSLRERRVVAGLPLSLAVSNPATRDARSVGDWLEGEKS